MNNSKIGKLVFLITGSKNLMILLLLLSQGITTKDLFSQQNMDIDPRQYLRVFEVNKLDKKNIIWQWEADQMTNQKRKVIDTESKIQIEFFKNKIAGNDHFKGNITIEGQIVSTSGGEDPVEVFPYSRIGEKKRKIGMTSRPAKEIAQIFINLLIESYEAIDRVHEPTHSSIQLDSNHQNQHLSLDAIRQLNNRLKVIIEYIYFFKSSGNEAEDVFLSFIQLDYILLDNIEDKLIQCHEQFNTFIGNQQETKSTPPLKGNINPNIEEQYHIAIKELTKLSALKGTQLGQYLQNKGSFTKHNRSTYYQSLINNKSDLLNYLAKESSKIIYLNLDYATIDLLKERSQEGDYLYIYVILEEQNRRSPASESEVHQKVLPIGRFLIRNTGWSTKVTDSFILAHRVNEPDHQRNETVSPSNFKGAPGVTLLLTHRKTGNPNNLMLNFIQPSIGLDVSYIDFSTEDDVEIGLGIILGLFDNQVFGTCGLNLNRTGSKEESPFYVGIGFSFANMANKLMRN